MSLRRLQSHLERIYEVEVEHDVDDFLITDVEVARRLDDGPNARASREKLLVSRQGEEIGLSLYVDAEVVDKLGDDDPVASLHAGNLDEFWTALEGVSHFLYFTWNASHQRQVSRLELEMQAEVDKYITTTFLLGHQRDGCIPPGLHRKLFTECAWDQSLGESDLEIYRSANHYAGRYCAELESTYLRDRRQGGMVSELRRFYRLTQNDKIRRIVSH